jgi:hypothetical protein
VTHERLPSFFRLVGAALALSTLASPLLESLHEAGVRHVACPEDGELVEAPLQPAHAHAAAAGMFAERDGTPASGAAHHSHCAIVLQSHLRAREALQVALAAPALRATEAPPALASPFRPARALYRIAPKASPPLA